MGSSETARGLGPAGSEAHGRRWLSGGARRNLRAGEATAGGAVMTLARKLLAEFLGTGVLLATVVGSGIMGVALSQGNDGIALLANAAATAGILYVLISVLGPTSGAHFNPAVSLAMRLRGEMATMEALSY